MKKGTTTFNLTVDLAQILYVLNHPQDKLCFLIVEMTYLRFRIPMRNHFPNTECSHGKYFFQLFPNTKFSHNKSSFFPSILNNFLPPHTCPLIFWFPRSYFSSTVHSLKNPHQPMRPDFPRACPILFCSYDYCPLNSR